MKIQVSTQVHVHRAKNIIVTEVVKNIDLSTTTERNLRKRALKISRQNMMKKKRLSHKIISIEIRCATSDWTTPANGVKKPQQDCGDGRTVRVNTICKVECNSGYELKGTSTAACTPQGNWNPSSSPTCTG